MQFQTAQEEFWAGEFGNAYTERNAAQAVPSQLAFWSRVLHRTSGVTSVLELGSNVGLNLRALRALLPAAHLGAVEINLQAARELEAAGVAGEVHNASIFDFSPGHTFDLAFTCGVLIHIAPEMLPSVYDALHRSSHKYIAVSEYYSPTPVGVPYRGHTERLFKRDFAGELMDRFPDLKLVDYGFVYRRDPNFKLDDVTWFLLEKRTR